MENKETNQIVKTESQAYGYSYASLSDIAKQGYKILKTKTKIDELTGKEYVWYYDEELKDWIQGAQVVIISSPVNKEGSKKMNEAQCYGSALTYARRYTMQMALGLACDDDKEIENTNKDGSKLKKVSSIKATPGQVSAIEKLYDAENLIKILDYYKVENLGDLTIEQASEVIAKKSKK